MIDLCQGPESANRHLLLCVRECWALVMVYTQLKDSYPTNQVEGFISNMQGFNSTRLFLPVRSSMVDLDTST